VGWCVRRKRGASWVGLPARLVRIGFI
jgi:hypothetical protein